MKTFVCYSIFFFLGSICPFRRRIVIHFLHITIFRVKMSLNDFPLDLLCDPANFCLTFLFSTPPVSIIPFGSPSVFILVICSCQLIYFLFIISSTGGWWIISLIHIFIPGIFRFAYRLIFFL